MSLQQMSLIFACILSINCTADIRSSEGVAGKRQQKIEKYIKSANELESIRITTLNLGFLNLLKLDLLKVPEYETRLKLLEQTLQSHLGSEQYSDVVSLQEVWHEDAISAVCQLAEKSDYTCISGGRDEVEVDKKYSYFQHGLVVLVRNGLITDNSRIQFSFLPFYRDGKHVRAYMDYFAGVVRGVLMVKVSMEKRSFVVMSTHFTALVSSNSIRKNQVRSLLRYVKKYKNNFDYVFVAGDLNLSPSFRFSLPNVERDGTDEQWEENAKNYDLLVSEKQAGLIDTFRAFNRTDPGYTQDRTKNDLTKYSSSTKNEPEQRLDYIFYTSLNKGCSIQRSNLVATSPLSERDEVVVSKDSGARIFSSDHFGVRTELNCL